MSCLLKYIWLECSIWKAVTNQTKYLFASVNTEHFIQENIYNNLNLIY
jgi:hypothetical protein